MASDARIQAASAQAGSAHRDSVALPLPEVVQVLREVLGTTLVAHIAGSDVKAVAEWSTGSRAPQPAKDARLRAALQAVRLIQAVDSPHVVRAWFIGLNPQLSDEAPATALSQDQLKDVLVAARAFAEAG